MPDDYADRYLPEIMARFSRAYPSVELSVICEPSVDLLERIDANEIDLAIVTNYEIKARLGNLPARTPAVGDVEPARDPHRRALAAGARTADLQLAAFRRRPAGNLAPPYRILYSSSNAGAVAAAVLAGFAVSVLPESGLRPGMRVLTAADGFPELPRLPYRSGAERP